MSKPHKRVTIKISRQVHQALAIERKHTGVPISKIIRLAVAAWTHGKRPTRWPRRHTKRGSR